tara:strand:- start:12 stop:200 length:189 start_codon:yes stop_codon:yes gene_type:complete
MKTYDVSLWVEEGYCVTVKAKTEEEAEEIALCSYGDPSDERVVYTNQVHGDRGTCGVDEAKT